MTASPELPKGGLKGLQGLPTPVRQTRPLSIPCPATLKTIFILFWYYAISHSSFNLLPGSYGFFDSSLFVQISIFWFYNLEFATYRAEASQLGALEAVLYYWASCPVSPRFITTEEALQGLMFPSTSLITNQAVAPKCALPGCLRCSIFARWTSFCWRSLQNLAVSLDKC